MRGSISERRDDSVRVARLDSDGFGLFIEVLNSSLLQRQVAMMNSLRHIVACSRARFARWFYMAGRERRP